MFLITSQWLHKFSLTCCKIQYIMLVLHIIFMYKNYINWSIFIWKTKHSKLYFSKNWTDFTVDTLKRCFDFFFLLWKLQFTLQLIVFWWFTVYDGMKSNKLKDCLKTITHQQHSSASNGTFRIGHSTFLLTSVM